VWTCGCGTELIKAMPDFVPKETRGRVLVLWGFGRWWGANCEINDRTA